LYRVCYDTLLGELPLREAIEDAEAKAEAEVVTEVVTEAEVGVGCGDVDCEVVSWSVRAESLWRSKGLIQATDAAPADKSWAR
jgi:hypothetical protein